MEPENIFSATTIEDTPPRATIDWTIWVQWLLASTGGWIVGLAFGNELVLGVFLGLAQWLVLRRYVANAGWWIFATALGWLIGWAIIMLGAANLFGAGLLSAMVTGAVFGLTLGLAQWLALRRWVQVAGMWVLLSVPGWTIGLTGILGDTLTGAAVGAITGLALDFLLRFPRNK